MDIEILSVPYFLGRERVGMGLGPDRFLAEGAAQAVGKAGREVTVARVQLPAPFLHEIGAAVALNRALAEHVRGVAARGAVPVVLAGNCNSALGILAGLPGDVGVVWLDAHGDFNTPETTTSGFLDGMALAMATGRCWKGLRASIPGLRAVPEERVLLVGAQALDPEERELLAGSRVVRLSPAQFDRGLERTVDRMAARLGEVYLHVDMDVLDPSEGRANEYAAPGGLLAAQVQRLVRLVAARLRVCAVALTAYDPECDPEGKVARVGIRVLEELVKAGR